MNKNDGIPFNVVISIDLKSAAIFACAIFVGLAAALIIYKNA